MPGSLEWYLDLVGLSIVIAYISFWLYSLVRYQNVFEKGELIRSWMYLCGVSLVLISAGVLKLTHGWEFERFENLVFGATLYLAMVRIAIWANLFYLFKVGGNEIIFYPIHHDREYFEPALSSEKSGKLTILLVVLAIVLIIIPISQWGYLMYRFTKTVFF